MKYILLLSSLTFFFAACYQDDINEPVVIDIIVDEPRTEMETGLMGVLRDANGDAISGYNLNINQDIYEVIGDAFFIEVKGAIKYGQLIEAYNQDRLIGLSYPYLVENDVNKIEVYPVDELLQRPLTNGVNQLSVGEALDVTLDRNDLLSQEEEVRFSSIALPQNLLRSYFGTIGYDTNGDELALVPTNGYVINVTKANNQLIGLDVAKTIKLQAELGEQEAMFWYDAQRQYWLKLSSENQFYISTGFGYFMSATFKKGYYVESEVRVESGPVSFMKTEVDGLSSYTTMNGVYATIVGETETELSFLSPCNDSIGSVQISGNGANQQRIEIQGAEQFITMVNTEIVDCDGGSSVSPGIIIPGTVSDEYYIFNEAVINHNIAVCNGYFDVAGYDYLTDGRGPSIAWQVTTEDDLGFLSHCNDDEGGFSYIMIRGDRKTYKAFTLEELDENRYQLTSENGKVRIAFDDNGIGEYEAQQSNIYMKDEDFGADGYSINCENAAQGCNINDFYISHFERMNNGLFRVSFSGEVWMQTIRSLEYGDFPVAGVIIVKS